MQKRTVAALIISVVAMTMPLFATTDASPFAGWIGLPLDDNPKWPPSVFPWEQYPELREPHIFNDLIRPYDTGTTSQDESGKRVEAKIAVLEKRIATLEASIDTIIERNVVSETLEQQPAVTLMKWPDGVIFVMISPEGNVISVAPTSLDMREGWELKNLNGER